VADTACPRESGESRKTNDANTTHNIHGARLGSPQSERFSFCITASRRKQLHVLKSFMFESPTKCRRILSGPINH
jgi:hypothetical protein